MKRCGLVAILVVLAWSSPALGLQLLYEVTPILDDVDVSRLGTHNRILQRTDGGTLLGKTAEGKLFVWTPDRGIVFRESEFSKEFTHTGPVFLSNENALYGNFSYKDDFGVMAPAHVLNLNNRQFRALEAPPKFLDDHDFCEIERFTGMGEDGSMLGVVHCHARGAEGDRHAFRVRGGSAILVMPVYSTMMPGSPRAHGSRPSFSDAMGAVYGIAWDSDAIPHAAILSDPPQLMDTQDGLVPEALFPVGDKLVVGLSENKTPLTWRQGVLTVHRDAPFNCPLFANSEGLILARKNATCDRANHASTLSVEWGVTNDLLTWTSRDDMTFLLDGSDVEITTPIALLDDDTIYAHYAPEPGKLMPVILKPRIVKELEIKSDYDVADRIEVGEPFLFAPTLNNRPTSFEIVGAEIVGDIDQLVTLATPVMERECTFATVQFRGEDEEMETPVPAEVGAIFDRFRCAFNEDEVLAVNKRAKFPFELIAHETGVLNSGFTGNVVDASGTRDSEAAATEVDVVDWSGGVSCEVAQVDEKKPLSVWKAVTGAVPEPSDVAHAVWAVTVHRENVTASRALTQVTLEIGVPEGVALSEIFGAWRVAAADGRSLTERASGTLGVTCKEADRKEVSTRVFACDLEYRALYDAWEQLPSDVTIFFGLQAPADLPKSELSVRALSLGTKGDCTATVMPNFGGAAPTGPVSGGCCATVSHERTTSPWATLGLLLLGMWGVRRRSRHDSMG